MKDLGSPPHAHAPLPDSRTPTAPQDAEIRAAYGNFLRGMRRDIVRPFLMGAAAAFGMSLGAFMPAGAPTSRPHAYTTPPHAQATRFGICAPSVAERSCC